MRPDPASERYENLPISLSPLTRLHMEAAAHFKIAPRTLYDSSYAERLASRIGETDQKLATILKQCAQFSFFLLLTVATGIKGVSIFGYSLAALSFVTEALLLGCALSFFFLCTTLVTSQGYKALLRAWSSVQDPIDITNIDASYHTDDMISRIFRSKSNFNDIYRSDFYEPGKGFKVLSVVAHISIFVVLGLTVIVYAIVQFLGALNSFVDHPLGYWPTIVILGTCLIAHVIGLALVVSSYKDFAFSIVDRPFKNRHNETSE